MDLTTLFCNIDDFVKTLDYANGQILVTSKKSNRGSRPQMSLSELMTIIVLCHLSGFKNFKSYYFYLLKLHCSEFPKLLSYNRFVEWMPYCLLPLCSYLKSRRGSVTGISYVDSCPIAVCKNIRINRNKVFNGLAKRGKSSMGWFFGFKLHIIVNEVGELYGDKGYISKKLFEELWDDGVHLITNVKSNMKNKLISLHDKLLLRKRFIIETINDQLKNISNIEHSRHRSPVNFMVNLIAGLISYTWQEKKPSITISENLRNALSV